jgi:primosomal protein N' (replication factor Y)
MYIQVKLLNGLQKTLTYKVPSSWNISNLKGALVTVPLQKRVETGYVQKVMDTIPQTPFAIRPAQSIIPFPHDLHYHSFILKLSAYHCIEPDYFLKRIKQFLHDNPIDQEIVLKDISSQHKDITLTDDQQNIVHALYRAIDNKTYFPALIHGVTGSGKTEIYKKVMIKNHENGTSTLLLLPEVSLAVQFYHKLKAELSDSIDIFTFHSATSAPDKKRLWNMLLARKPVVIIGVHLPLLLPVPNLGSIIIDEEHDTGFQEKKHPKINTRQAALIRASLNNIPIILGSATPSIESLYHVSHKKWHFFSLHKRFAGQFPRIVKVDLKNEKRHKKHHFFISNELKDAIDKTLKRKEQTLIFLNRRGMSFFTQCKDCGSIPSCNQCSVSLTLHNDNILKCHYCNYTINAPDTCPDCSKKNILKKGIGTQYAVTLLQKLFPDARIERADLDSTVNKKKWRKTMEDFEDGAIDILVGTQTITKGYHFPKVTLVGILWADLHLHFPQYNAGECTLQQLIQVAGRAGRNTENSLVIVQTLIDHPIYKYLNEVDYASFYTYEISKRKEVMYPPIIRLAEIELKCTDKDIIEQEAETINDFLLSCAEKYEYKARVLGPALPPVHTVKKYHIRKIYIKSDSIKHIIHLFSSINQSAFKSAIYLVHNPL